MTYPPRHSPELAIASDARSREILGLPPASELHSYYDLLGVPAETSDDFLQLVLIDRIERVRRYQLGSSQSKAIELLELLSRLYVRLTDADERRRYDAEVAWERNAGLAAPHSAQPAPGPNSGAVPPAPRALGEHPPGICPQCGKPSPEKIPRCYHCGYQKQPVPPARARVPETPSANEAPSAWMGDVRSWKDLSPEDLRRRLQLNRELYRANKLGRNQWKRPGEIVSLIRGSKSTETVPRSMCYRCGRGLAAPDEAFGFLHEELRQNAEFLTMSARRFESLGKSHFQWPLDQAAYRKVRDMIPPAGHQRIVLACLSCAERFLQAEKISS